MAEVTGIDVEAREIAEALAMSRTTAKKWLQRVQDKTDQQEAVEPH